MAFEAVLEQARAGGRPRAQRWRRAMLTLSLGVHVALLAVGLAYSLWQVDELPLPAVTVTLASIPPPPPPPPPAHRSGSIKPKTKPTQPKPETLVQPREQPKEQPKPKEEAEEEEEGAQQGGVQGGVKGGVQGGVVGGVVGAPLAKDTGPRLLTPQIAKGLLLIDPNDERYRVRLPPALVRAGVTVTAVVYVCVSVQGTVSGVRVVKGAGPAIDPQLPAVIGRWRYRPLLIDGRPTPFCYHLAYEYSER